jgi:hypothetical protein
VGSKAAPARAGALRRVVELVVPAEEALAVRRQARSRPLPAEEEVAAPQPATALQPRAVAAMEAAVAVRSLVAPPPWVPVMKAPDAT